MSKAEDSNFDLLLKTSITTKFAIMMGGFMLILMATIGATFWTSTMQEGDTRVINIAGRQRMLSQKMTKEAMAMLRGEVKKAEILATAEQFEKSLGNLISGNPKEKIPPTKEAHIKAQLGKVKAIWVKFYENLTKLADIADQRAAAYSAISETNLTLLKDMNDAVFMMEQEGLDARTINLAGRQRMLSQKMAKEALLMEAGEAKAEDFQATVNLFDVTLRGLIDGSKELGLGSMKNAAVLSQLRKVEERWNAFR
ncbi:MAG: type IV pili methyl-accepting chemotaxis transducer N-terminal domain-containing protein, partial [bacterium]|nr:type IV pili methyl-accepting chemotaxis transducer N-terminal domain-containing protein [bacterium]